jgi:protein-tyrosine phosphatase
MPWIKEGHKTLPTRTSASHPITVSWLDAAAPDGRLGLCYCPGKNVVREGVRWARSLDEDLAHLISAHGVNVVVCLLSDAELRAIGVGRDYAACVRKAGLELIQLPIIEMFAPEDISDAMRVVEDIFERIQLGSKCVLHCRGGVGRAGMLGGCLLLRMGICSGVKEAIQLVRRRRCKRAIESRSQEKFISEFARLRGMEGKDNETGPASSGPDHREAGQRGEVEKRTPRAPLAKPGSAESSSSRGRRGRAGSVSSSGACANPLSSEVRARMPVAGEVFRGIIDMGLGSRVARARAANGGRGDGAIECVTTQCGRRAANDSPLTAAWARPPSGRRAPAGQVSNLKEKRLLPPSCDQAVVDAAVAPSAATTAHHDALPPMPPKPAGHARSAPPPPFSHAGSLHTPRELGAGGQRQLAQRALELLGDSEEESIEQALHAQQQAARSRDLDLLLAAADQLMAAHTAAARTDLRRGPLAPLAAPRRTAGKNCSAGL